MQRAVTELAYLRDAMTRGIIDDDRTGSGEATAGQDLDRSAERRSSSRRDERPIRRSGGDARVPSPRTRRPAIPARPAWAAITRPQARSRRRPACLRVRRLRLRARWGRLLPNTLRSTPPGNRPESREPRMAGRQLTPAGICAHRAARGGGAGAPSATAARSRGAAQGRRRDQSPAGRLRDASAGDHRCAAARGRRRLNRSGQVDAGQLPGRPGGQRSRCDPPDHPSAGAGPPQQRRPLVHR